MLSRAQENFGPEFRFGLGGVPLGNEFAKCTDKDAWFPEGGWQKQYALARKGAFLALSKMRDEGIIRAWGVGVNTPDAILKVIEDADPDVWLCARQYSLIDHANALNQVFPAVRAKNVSLVIGSALNAGFISGSPRYNYGKENVKVPPEAIQKLGRLRAVAERHGVDLRTAALHSRQPLPRPLRSSWARAANGRYQKIGIRCRRAFRTISEASSSRNG